MEKETLDMERFDVTSRVSFFLQFSSEDRAGRLTASKMAIVTIFRSWAGIC